MHSVHNPLDLVTLEQIINHSPLVVTRETSVADAIALMSQAVGSNCHLSNLRTSDLNSFDISRNSCVLVVDGLHLQGILTERDIVKLTALGTDLSAVAVGEVMADDVITLKLANNNVLTALSLLRQHEIRHLPIVDEFEKLVGIITPNCIRQILRPMNLLRMRHVCEVMNTHIVRAAVLLLSNGD
jgi:CBS domain-containing protein